MNFIKKLLIKQSLFFDEPTTGLHTYDVDQLMKMIENIVDMKATAVIIEHNLDVIKLADYIIDLGPNGGDDGGQIIATGTPEEVNGKSSFIYRLLFEESISG